MYNIYIALLQPLTWFPLSSKHLLNRTKQTDEAPLLACLAPTSNSIVASEIEDLQMNGVGKF